MGKATALFAFEQAFHCRLVEIHTVKHDMPKQLHELHRCVVDAVSLKLELIWEEVDRGRDLKSGRLHQGRRGSRSQGSRCVVG